MFAAVAALTGTATAGRTPGRAGREPRRREATTTRVINVILIVLWVTANQWRVGWEAGRALANLFRCIKRRTGQGGHDQTRAPIVNNPDPIPGPVQAPAPGPAQAAQGPASLRPPQDIDWARDSGWATTCRTLNWISSAPLWWEISRNEPRRMPSKMSCPESTKREDVLWGQWGLWRREAAEDRVGGAPSSHSVIRPTLARLWRILGTREYLEAWLTLKNFLLTRMTGKILKILGYNYLGLTAMLILSYLFMFMMTIQELT